MILNLTASPNWICGCAVGRKYSTSYVDMYLADWEKTFRKSPTPTIAISNTWTKPLEYGTNLKQNLRSF